ncbi:MAG TPA: DUF6064 family protein, partial [Woeseiaceae bacterium]|nr:DUF6064 family protein [Woeseiaceae bacterium]
MIVYALSYPLLAMAGVHARPRTPTFGVPCPTTLMTVGYLLMAVPVRRMLLVLDIAIGTYSMNWPRNSRMTGM